MSRYTTPTLQPGQTCVVGWDPPLGTFFAQVHACPAARRPPRLLLWVGTDIEDIRTVQELAQALAPYANLPANLQRQLEADRRGAGFRPNLGTQLLRQLRRTAQSERGPV